MTEGQSKDALLTAALYLKDNYGKNSGPLSSKLSEATNPTISIEMVARLAKKISEENGLLLKVIPKGKDFMCLVTSETKDFLSNGGFEKIENDEKRELILQSKKEDFLTTKNEIEYIKTKEDLNNIPETMDLMRSQTTSAKRSMRIACIALGIALLSLIMTSLSEYKEATREVDAHTLDLRIDSLSNVVAYLKGSPSVSKSKPYHQDTLTEKNVKLKPQ